MNDNLDYTQSSKISEREKLDDSFENWFSKLAYNNEILLNDISFD